MGLTVLDAGVVIGLLDGDDAHHVGARRAIRAALDRGDRLVLPASALAEALVAPSRMGPEAVEAVQRLLDRLPIAVEPVDEEVAVEAAATRAAHPKLRLPDALVIATAALLGADQLVTTDRRWPTKSRLRIRCAVEVV